MDWISDLSKGLGTAWFEVLFGIVRVWAGLSLLVSYYFYVYKKTEPPLIWGVPAFVAFVGMIYFVAYHSLFCWLPESWGFARYDNTGYREWQSYRGALSFVFALVFGFKSMADIHNSLSKPLSKEDKENDGT